MATCKEWLNQKFIDWEKAQGRSQSYYAFARYLGVGQNELALWMDGSSVPAGDDLAALADKLGAEVYDTLALARPNTANQRLTASVAGLPSGLRDRLTNAILEADQVLKSRRLPPESVDAKLAVVEVFLKWGIKFTN
jgi:transcriptional regulator with XRE-family HTH domain